MAESRVSSGKIIIATRVHVIIIGALSFFGPAIAGYLSYEKSMADIDKHFVEASLIQEQTFAKKTDVDAVADKLAEMNSRLSNIEGYLKALSRK